jgi:hypothetical protein
VFKTWNRTRDQHDQFMRLKHMARGPEILGLSRTLQGIEETVALRQSVTVSTRRFE